MKHWLRIGLLVVLALSLLMAGCSDDKLDGSLIQTEPDETTSPAVDLGDLVILYTGCLRGVYAQDEAQGQIGYPALAEYKAQLEELGHHVVLLDGGDSLGNEGAGAFENGDALWDIVDATGYDIRVPGALELSYGVEALEERDYISCNLMDALTGAAVFNTYWVVEVGDISVGYVGITAPGEVDGYSFCEGNNGEELYDAVQRAIDDAVDAGADYVIAVANTGTDPDDSPWTSAEIIANTTGLSAYLDCGSGSVIEGDVVVDMDDFEVPVCAVGAEFNYVGQVTLDLDDGTAQVLLLDALGEEDSQIKALADDLAEALEKAEAATEPVEEAAEATEETEE